MKSFTTHTLWGKITKNDKGEVSSWLSLEDHCTDVAAVFRELSKVSGIRRQLNAAAGFHLQDGQIERLSVLACLHDLGKCNNGFRRKAFPDGRNLAGHVQEVGVFLRDRELQPAFLEAIGYAQLQNWCVSEEGVLRLLLASVSHHGKPIEPEAVVLGAQKRHWQSHESSYPIEDIHDLFTTVKERFPKAFDEDISPMNATVALQHTFCGLVTLADWIGSHAEHFFPFEIGEQERTSFSVHAARKAVNQIGLEVTSIRDDLKSGQSFNGLFPGYEPTPLQDLVCSGIDSQIAVVEAETGSGKTEAALSHFYQLFKKGQVDGLYFALPTRVAARELYQRVLDFVQRVFPEECPPVVLAVPGYAHVDGEPVSALPGSDRLYDEDRSSIARERAWAAERPKRFLAAPIAVGTIDQALLSVLQVKHAHMRGICLRRSLLVVDEVHASDTYMLGLLRRVLAEHTRAGSYALLLSATLGKARKEELLAPERVYASGNPTASLQEAIASPYPSITTERECLKPREVSEPVKDKKVNLEPYPGLEYQDALSTGLINELAQAMKKGARVLIVCNTVARAVATVRAAEQHEGVREALFTCRNTVSPHHGRYARQDREVLDTRISEVFGKKAQGGAVLLVGTQTLEQSLDIDADWLITDLCPIDVLLQRIGRLHRHARQSRPVGFETARCTVLLPTDRSFEFLFASDGSITPLAGLGGYVYPDLRIARLTSDVIGNGITVHIPQENRRLVETATNPEQLEQFRSGPWKKHRDELLASEFVQINTATHSLICRKCEFGDQELAFADIDERIQTRLGFGDRRLQLGKELRSPFGITLNEITIPGWMVKGIEADHLDDDPTATEGGFVFRYGGRSFRYGRYGLERVDEE